MKKRTLLVVLAAILLLTLLCSCSTEGKDLLKPFRDRTINYLKMVELGEYRGVEVEKVVPREITEEEIRLAIQSERYNYAEINKVDRPAQMGDIVVADYAGYIPGAAFENGSASGEEIVLGLGQYISGFEEGIVGMSAGETKTVEVDFPDDYRDEELKGKHASFVITVSEVYEAILPEYDETYAKDKLGMASIEEYERAKKESLVGDAETEAKNQQFQNLWKKVREGCKILSYPEGKIESYVSDCISYYENMAAYTGMEFGEFLKEYYKMDEENFRAAVNDMAYTEIGDEVIIRAIIQKEKIKLSKEEYENEKQKLIKSMGFDSEEAFQASYGSSFEEYYGKENIEYAILQEKVFDIVEDNAVIK